MADKIELIFLGTSGAVPTSLRNTSSIFLKYKDRGILIDCGEGTQRQLRKANINPCKITDILITHWHGDHVLGLPGLLETLSLNKYTPILKIYGPPGTEKFIHKVFDVFMHSDKIKYEVKEVSRMVFENPDFKINCLPLAHNRTIGYLFEEKDRRRIDKKKLGRLRIEKKDFRKIGMLADGKDITLEGKKIKSKQVTFLEKGRKIAFVFDSGYCKNAIRLSKNADLIIADSTFSETESDLAKEYNHMTSVEAAKVAKLSGGKELILTHISQRLEFKENILLNEAKKIFKNVKVAKDFMKIDL